MIVLPLIFLLTFVQGAQEPSTELRAAMFLGSRAAQMQRALPIVHQVVLVPDEATYLDEISRWSPEARWPVLFVVCVLLAGNYTIHLFVFMFQ